MSTGSGKPVSTDSNNAELKSTLLQIARDLVRTSGMTAFNLRVVAELANTSTQAIYTQFGGKSGLILALYKGWVVELEQRLLPLLATSTPIEMLLHTALIYREQASSDPELFLSGSSPAAAEADILGMMFNSRVFTLFVSFLETGVKDGIFKPMASPERTAKALWAAVHGAVIFELSTRTPHEPVNSLNDLLPILLKGLG